MQKEKFTFIDLFSGIGGFHQAMTQLGGECLLASEIDSCCNEVYKKNYGLRSDVNVRDITEEDIEKLGKYDVLCAGFPCQAFSKAGKQEGLQDETRGTLFFEIKRLLSYYQPPYIVLENVRNLVSHDKGKTWEIIKRTLHKLGYRLTPSPLILSPHQFGVPQLRERVIILGKYDPEHVEEPLIIGFEDLKKKEENSIYDVIDSNPVDEKYYISDYEKMVLTAWDEFYHGIDMNVIGFPIWSEYFGSSMIPEDFPEWKKEFVKKNQKLYFENREFIDQWLERYNNLDDFAPTHRKFEWQCGTTTDSIWNSIIQFRPSGVRVKSPTCFPALVAMVQIPIIGKYQRRMTVEEAAKLQSFPSDFQFSGNDQQSYKQLGNSVNVEVIKQAAKKLFEL